MFSMKTCPSRHPVEVQIESTSWKGVGWWWEILGANMVESVRVSDWGGELFHQGATMAALSSWTYKGNAKHMPDLLCWLSKRVPFNSSPKNWIIMNLPKNNERCNFLKSCSWDYHHGGSTAAPLWPSGHPLALNDVLDIPPDSLTMIREGRSGCERTEAQQRLLCGVGKKNYNLQPFCFLLPLMRISLANNRFIFSNNSSACQRQWVSLKICTRREEKGKMPTCCIFFWLLAAKGSCHLRFSGFCPLRGGGGTHPFR